MTANTANIIRLHLTDDAVRMVFIDQRPDVCPDEHGHSHDFRLINDVVSELVVSHAFFRKILDLGDKALEEHPSKMEKAKENG